MVPKDQRTHGGLDPTHPTKQRYLQIPKRPFSQTENYLARQNLKCLLRNPGNPNNAVNIVTRLDDQRIGVLFLAWVTYFSFPHLAAIRSECTQSNARRIPIARPSKEDKSVKLVTNMHLVSRSSMRGATPPSPHVFMVLCLITRRVKFKAPPAVLWSSSQGKVLSEKTTVVEGSRSCQSLKGYSIV